MRCRGAKSFVDDLVLSRGVVRSRAVHCCDLLRLSPLTRRFVRFRRTDLLGSVGRPVVRSVRPAAGAGPCKGLVIFSLKMSMLAGRRLRVWCWARRSAEVAVIGRGRRRYRCWCVACCGRIGFCVLTALAVKCATSCSPCLIVRCWCFCLCLGVRLYVIGRLWMFGEALLVCWRCCNAILRLQWGLVLCVIK